MRCRECASDKVIEIVMDNYDFDESGLEGIKLSGVPARKCESCGNVTVRIPRMEQLLRLIALDVIEHAPFTGPEVRFLRKFLGRNQENLAKILGVDATTISHWERGSKQIGPSNSRLICMLVRTDAKLTEYNYEEVFSSMGSAPEPRTGVTFKNASVVWQIGAQGTARATA